MYNLAFYGIFSLRNHRLRYVVAGLGMMTLCLSAASASEDVTHSPTILRIGNWAVHRTQNAMTDATVCTGIYNNDFNVQLTAHSLLIAMPDNVKNVRLRFDDDAPQAPRLPKRTERTVDAVDINGADFARLLQSKRLRYEVLTASGGVVDGDIDLNGVPLIHSNIESGCMGEPLPPPQPSATAATVAPAAAECSNGARARMAEKGISVQDIVTICTAQ